MLLGELLGNPKGTKSFSSWSEFTDFVNEMPIKTIQPFVSDFNAFAGEGFYGNVVQGLVIKQLEDVVFIFGIAIDGTLIFRKRNYPDVSTWEDPKIIIHSNNWHKIYFVTDLGELIGVNYLKKAFDYKNIILGSNESYELGICAGLVVIRNIYISAAFSLLLIDEFHNAVTTIAGNSIKELGLEFRFDTTDYKARMSIINVSSNNANIEISYQNLSF